MPPGATDSDVKAAAFESHDRAPTIGLKPYQTPAELRQKIHLAHVRQYYPNGQRIMPEPSGPYGLFVKRNDNGDFLYYYNSNGRFDAGGQRLATGETK